MATWLLILVTISIAALLKFLFSVSFATKKSSKKVPPGPNPIITSLLSLRISGATDLESILKSLHAKFGPIVTLYFGLRPNIFIADRFLAHKALVENGAIFSDRPPVSLTLEIVSNNRKIIGLAPYGSVWRALRRNLNEEILSSSRMKSYSHVRTRVIQILQSRLESESKSGHPVCVKDHFIYAIFCLLVIMCFGDQVEENQIKQVKHVQRQMFLSFPKFRILNFWPRLTKILFRKRWQEFFQLLKNQQDVSIPLIRARKKLLEERRSKSRDTEDDRYFVSYVDSLLELELPGDNGKLEEEEMGILCNEILNGGTDTTATALEWIMANLVKYPEIQEKLFLEIKGVVGDEEAEVKEGDLQKLLHLKAVILEGLRRHPPTHLLVPHAVTKEAVLDGYLIPKNASINCMAAEMGWDPKVWEDPMAFKPERFINNGREEFDITGSREIKMMPFGVGRRICPGYRLAMLHLEYFVANLVWKYEWKAVDGVDVDLSEKEERTIVMKCPLKVHILPRLK